MTEEDQYDEEDGRTVEDRMIETYGCRDDWEADAARETYWYSDPYRRFLENGCRGVLTYEQAVQEYKWSTGLPPDLVTSWPELDWVKSRREKCAENEESIQAAFGLSVDEFRALHWPYEPMLRYAY